MFPLFFVPVIFGAFMYLIMTQDTKLNIHENARKFEHSYKDMKRGTMNSNAGDDDVH